jgi:hypothetical protein
MNKTTLNKQMHICENLAKTLEARNGMIEYTHTDKGVAVYGIASTFLHPRIASIFEGLGYNTACCYDKTRDQVYLEII